METRRHFVRSGLATIGAVALAGCQQATEGGTPGNNSDTPNFEAAAEGEAAAGVGDLPPHSAWVPRESQNESSTVLHSYYEFGPVKRFMGPFTDALGNTEDSFLPRGSMETFLQEVPVFGVPLAATIIVSYGHGEALFPFDIFPVESADGRGTEATAFCGESVNVNYGVYDPAALAEQAIESEEAVFEEEANRGEFTVYTGYNQEREWELAFAVSPEMLLTSHDEEGYNPTESVLAALDRYQNEQSRVVDTDGGEWLYRNARSAPLITGRWFEERGVDTDQTTEGTHLKSEEHLAGIEQNPALEGVRGYLSTLSCSVADGEADTQRMQFLAVFPTADDTPSSGTVRDHLVRHGDVQSDVSIEENQLYVESSVEVETLRELIR